MVAVRPVLSYPKHMQERNDQQEIRFQRRQQLLDDGVSVYPARTNITTNNADLLAGWKLETKVTVGGRIRGMRIQGGSAFIDLDDGTAKIQLFLQKKALGDDFATFTKDIDLGDFIEATGITFVTKAGESSVNVSALTWLGKTLRPLPSSWHGVEDVELRYRHRELDFLINQESKKTITQRSLIVKTIRDFLEQSDFLEIETPILQTLAGGASAKPFVTHHQALNADLYLRVAPELYLKRLISGGFPRVFEFARCFRNEGIDRDHNPEFTQVELYAAYRDYRWLMEQIEIMLHKVAQAVHGKSIFIYQDKEIAIPKHFTRLSYHRAVLDFAKVDIDTASDADLLKKARDGGADVPTKTHRMKLIDELFKTFVRPKLIEPTIIYDYPADMIPLAKRTEHDSKYVECFQVLMGGTELCKAFSELNDPVDQRARFVEQEKMRADGDDEAQRIDEDFLQALEYGLPPTAGLGMGIERLTALITGQHHVKEVIAFPTLRPKA